MLPTCMESVEAVTATDSIPRSDATQSPKRLAQRALHVGALVRPVSSVEHHRREDQVKGESSRQSEGSPRNLLIRLSDISKNWRSEWAI